MIILHRLDPDGYPVEDRIALPADDVRQVHEGKGGITIVTTPIGKLPVQEDLDTVVEAVEAERKDVNHAR